MPNLEAKNVVELSNEAERRSRIADGRSRLARMDLGIPQRFAGKSLVNLDLSRDAIASAKKAITQKQGVYIWGPVGIGKTHLAIGLLLDWFANRLDSEYLSLAVKGSGRVG